jgi:glycosyltransferase involved in cell wall biosynthesis
MQRDLRRRSPSSHSSVQGALQHHYRWWAAIAVRTPIALVALPAALALALLRRRRRPVKPRVLLGVTPIINIKYWSSALRDQGYETRTLVYDVYSINEPDDFDYTPERLFPRLSRSRAFVVIKPFACFFWALGRFDVFVFSFDGGLLRGTPLQYLELPLYALADLKVIAIPYGGDAIDVRRCRDPATREALLNDYPQLERQRRQVARRVAHYSRWVPCIVCGGVMVDFLPRFDILVTSALSLNTEEWRPASPKLPSARRNSNVTILHAPNHRHIKGTEFLLRACDELRSEGVPVELILKERVANTEIRRTMQEVDIVASAFVMGYYELFAVEGMSMAKPVLNYWRPDLKALYSEHSYASECPIVDAPPALLKDRIRMLAEDPDMRRRLGEDGRRYVEKHHSLEATGKFLDELISGVWNKQNRAGDEHR